MLFFDCVLAESGGRKEREREREREREEEEKVVQFETIKGNLRFSCYFIRFFSRRYYCLKVAVTMTLYPYDHL